jgi:hypothetical protein
VPLRAEGTDHRTRTLTSDQPLPRRFDIRAERRHRAQTRHDNTPLRRAHRPTTITFGRTRKISIFPIMPSDEKAPAVEAARVLRGTRLDCGHNGNGLGLPTRGLLN